MGKGKAAAVKDAEEELRVAGAAKARVEAAFKAAEENLRVSRKAGGHGGGVLLSHSLPVAAASPRGRGWVRGAGRGGSGAAGGAGPSPASSSSFRGGRGVPRGPRGSWVPRGGSCSLPPPLNSTPPPPLHSSTPRPQHPRRGPRGASFHNRSLPPAPRAVSPQVSPPDVRGIVEELVRALAPALAGGVSAASSSASPASSRPSGGGSNL